MSRPRRGPARLVLFSLLAFGLGLAGFEGLCRALEARADWLPGPFESDGLPEPLGLSPGSTVEHLGVVTGIHEGGFVPPFRPVERGHRRTLRVAALGDSFTFGWGVEPHLAWPARLEEGLARRLLPERGVPVEVLNFGVPGWNTHLERVHYERVVRRYRPDLVLLGYYSNDGAIDRRVPNVHRFCPEPAPPVQLRLAAALEGSAAVRVVHDLAWFVATGSPVPSWDSETVLRTEHYGFRCSMAWLDELAALVAEDGAPFLVVQLPHLDGVGGDQDPEEAAQERLAAELAARGIPHLNLYAAVKGRDVDAMQNLDLHPTAEAHAAFAEAILASPELDAALRAALPPAPP